jgi:hypothetical protein
MLAEIFMVRLEAAARVSQETIPASDSRFVPISLAGPLELKTSKTGPNADAAAKALRTF